MPPDTSFFKEHNNTGAENVPGGGGLPGGKDLPAELRVEIRRLRWAFRFTLAALVVLLLWPSRRRRRPTAAGGGNPAEVSKGKSVAAPVSPGSFSLPKTARSGAHSPAEGAAASVQRDFQAAAAKVRPAVVSLRVRLKVGAWREQIRRLREGGGAIPSASDGSGVIIEPSGLVLTNEHVVRNARSITVGLAAGRTLSARVLGTDPRSDLALLHLLPDRNASPPFPVAALGESDAVRVGQWALALGNPFGLNETLTVGVISAKGRVLPPMRSEFNRAVYSGVLQTDAAINPGNSGGPLFNLRGEVIGINTMIFSHTGRSEGFGFAIPVNEIRPLLPYLREGLPVEYGWLGVRLQEFSAAPGVFPTPQRRGALIAGVLPNTPAERGGLRHGMVIIAFDGKPISSVDELIFIVGRTPVGKRVTVSVVDFVGGGTRRVFHVRLGRRPTEMELARLIPADEEEAGGEKEGAVKGRCRWRGLILRELPPEEAKKRKAGVEVSGVVTGSPGSVAGLYEGALVDEVKRADKSTLVPVKTLKDFQAAVAGAKGTVALHTLLDGYVFVPPPEEKKTDVGRH